jgi:lipopolysaccharide transport system ATP-binding protein
MSSVAVRSTRLGKRYRIGKLEAYRTFRESVLDVLLAPARILSGRSGRSTTSETLWALREVSFEIGRGEIVGIIGRNGAGKSTLLKILSRITEPTEGEVKLDGRVGALLEVGTGFHPELTGRENIFLNGAILGMRRGEIVRRFDEIVAFSEVERFLDTPVKYYSSGMFTRLAFAVAAHLEPEILIIDEILAVGDARFQRKCLSKMESAGQEGRTVLFVSHNIPAITRLCPRTILLDQGMVVKDGPSHEVVTCYLSSGLGTTAAREWPNIANAPGNRIARLRAVRVRTADGQVSQAIDIRQAITVEMEFSVLEGGHRLVPNFHFFNEEGACAFATIEVDSPWHRRERPAGGYVSKVWIPGNTLAEGTLIVSASLATMDPVVVHYQERDAVAFYVVDSCSGDSARGDYGGSFPGVVRPLLRWETNFEPADEYGTTTVRKGFRVG